MSYARPSLQDIIDRTESDIKNRVEDSQTFLRNSVFKILARVFSGSSHLMYDFIDFIKDQQFISTADAETLEKHGAEYGIFKNFGARASGSATAIGTIGILIPAGTELQSTSENKYITNADYTIGTGGNVIINLTAKEVGTAYNEAAGIILDFISPIAGIISYVTVNIDGITNGANEDTTDEYRTKILNRKRKPPHGGAEGDYIKWALEYSGSITRAWEIPEYMGIGTIGLAFVEDNEATIFPDDTTKLAVKNYIFSHIDTSTGKTVGIPVTATPGFFIIDLIPYTLNFTIQISPNTSAVQAAVTAMLEELILQVGAPADTITIGEFYESIMGSVGLQKAKLIYPTTDVATPVSSLHRLGTITFQDYT